MMRKTYIKPVTDVVVISPVHIMAASLEKENRGFSIGGEYDETNTYEKGNNTFNVWNQSDDEKYKDTFLEID